MTVGVGIAGSGFMGRTWSEAARHHAPGTHLAGVALGRRAQRLADDYRVPLHGSFEELLSNDDVEIVVLATPPAVHLEQVIAAAEAGKHLLVEKPMAQDAHECWLMTQACEQADVTMAIVSQHRFRGAPAHAKQLIDEGVIGAVTMVRAIGPEVGFWDTSVTQDQWKLDPDQQTAFASWGTHGCDLLRWFTGSEPNLAFALIGSFNDAPPPGRSAMATYRFDSGAMAQVWMSYDMPSPGLGSALQFELVGDAGIIQLDSYGEVRLGVGDQWSVAYQMPAFDPTDPSDPIRLGAYGLQLQDVVDAVVERRSPMVDGRGGGATVAMIDAAELSADTGTGVLIDLRDEPKVTTVGAASA